MLRTTRAALAVLLAAGLAGAVAGSAPATATGHHRPDPVVYRPLNSAGWQPCAGLPGCTTLALRGDPKTGPSEAMFRLKAGTPFAKHWHTSPEHVVELSGTVTYHLGDGHTYRVGAGDYLYYPGHMVHWGQCDTGADCVYHVYDDRPYDIHPVP